MLEWRDIPGYESHYQASPTGQIRSVDKFIASKNGVKNVFRHGKILLPYTSGNGYLYVHLSMLGVPKNVLVHRLIAATFLNANLGGVAVNHINSIRDDNRVENLEVVTHKENVAHSIEFGSARRKRSQNPNARLTESDVVRIKKLLSQGDLNCREIGLIFGVNGPQIWKISVGRAWA